MHMTMLMEITRPTYTVMYRWLGYDGEEKMATYGSLDDAADAIRAISPAAHPQVVFYIRKN